MSSIAEEMKAILNSTMSDDELMHYGRLGMKWYQHIYGDEQKHAKYSTTHKGGEYTSDDVVFVSGKVKYDKPIPASVRKEIDNAVKANSKIIIGDAPGADTRVQDYLSKVGYKNVIVYTTDDIVRNNVGHWKVNKISGNGETEERKIRAQKDIAMANAATKGIVISSDDDRPDSATSLNIKRLLESNKSIQFYDYKKDEISSKGIDYEEKIAHYGMPRRSGRYPWGSGDDPYQHGRDFLGRVEELRNTGFTYTDDSGKTWTGDNAIAKSMGLTSTEFRTELSIAKNERRALDVARAKALREDGKNNSEIGREMGINESSVRSLLNEKSEARMNKAREVADFLKERSNQFKDDGGMIDVGASTNLDLNISRERLNEALYLLIPSPKNKR